jgi:hypothetical protein
MERLGDDETHDSVSEELQALVVAGRLVRMLVEPRPVDEGALEESGLPERETEPCGQLASGPWRDPSLPRPRPGRRQLACSSM